ncbi:NAD(P)H-binding protein [Mucilaginibacter terrae]|uniref:NAD(P)H-binding protein n=1 Tax=Mucilaginibacter terrae TaxID=1955052 RepID=UPI00363DDC25
MASKAIVAGASGLVGGELLQILLKEQYYDEVLILVRKELPLQNKKLVQLVVDFEKLDDFKCIIKGCALFCCLGSTKSKTPSQRMYRKVDHDYPVKLAHIAKENHIPNYQLVSAIGADFRSLAFYNKLKGETENDIQAIDLPTLHIYRPSLLTGSRKEYRLIEKLATMVMAIVNPILMGALKRYQSIPAATVAKAMYKQSLNKEKGVFIHPSDHIKKLA